jgi:hypothetical protein
MTVFETCNMLSICLEMYSFAPITDMGRRDERRLQLMTYVLFFSLLK